MGTPGLVAPIWVPLVRPPVCGLPIWGLVPAWVPLVCGSQRTTSLCFHCPLTVAWKENLPTTLLGAPLAKLARTRKSISLFWNEKNLSALIKFHKTIQVFSTLNIDLPFLIDAVWKNLEDGPKANLKFSFNYRSFLHEKFPLMTEKEITKRLEKQIFHNSKIIKHRRFNYCTFGKPPNRSSIYDLASCLEGWKGSICAK